MLKKRIITIAGKPGSGKSTTSKAVAEKLQYNHFSSGDLFRSIANERGINVRQANEEAEKESSIDDLVDSRLQEMGRTSNNIVLDSRTAWHWMPNSFKVYLDLDLPTAAKRILSSQEVRRDANEYVPQSIDEYVEELQQRLNSEERRYMALYKINPYNVDNYDLVINTADNSPEEAINALLRAYEAWLNSSET